MLKTVLRRRRRNDDDHKYDDHFNNNRNRTTGCNNWRITKLGTASRKEDKYSSFCRSSKRCEKSEAPHINKDSSPMSVLMLFFTENFHLLVEQTNIC